MQHDVIWVIVDRLTKSAHFLPVNVRGYAESLYDGIQGKLGYSFGTNGVRLQQQLSCQYRDGSI